MSVDKKKRREYEPPIVKELGGVFEQALGATGCNAGPSFGSTECSTGAPVGGACTGGFGDQGCRAGNTDQGSCSLGAGVSGGPCEGGWGV